MVQAMQAAPTLSQMSHTCTPIQYVCAASTVPQDIAALVPEYQLGPIITILVRFLHKFIASLQRSANTHRQRCTTPHLWLSLQQQVACIGCRNLADVKAGVQGLANAVQHREGAHHKREGGWEAEGLVVGGQQQVLHV